jgi:outer membrane protein OmpA-like peptidoglycan-associated protein
VEQVFLIHRKTGLLLGHAVAPDTPTKDPEMVSGMLTAIQDFVRDSMSGAEGDNLDMIRMGEVGVVLAYTADAILCGFVRGVPPRNLSRAFQERLDRIVQDKAHIFRKFSGDTSDFDSCRPQLEACLFGQGETTEKAGTSRFAKVLLFGLPALLIAGLLGWWIYTMVIDRRFSELAHQVASQRGVVVTRAEKRNGRFTIAGLRDPLAPDPAQLLAASGMPVGKVEFEWQEYHSLQTPFSTQRAFTELKDDLERRAFRFATGRADVPAEQRFLIEDVAAQIQSLLRAGTSLGKTLVIEVRGNHDPIGTEQSNSTLAMARAETVSTALISLGIPASQVKPLPADKEREACSAVKEEERLLCRSAGFTVKEIIP